MNRRIFADSTDNRRTISLIADEQILHNKLNGVLHRKYENTDGDEFN